jgi:hypothetical protein
MNRNFSRQQIIAVLVLISLLAALLTLYVVNERKCSNLASSAKEQAYAIQTENLLKEKSLLSVQINGSSNFQLQVTRALILLKLCDFETFAYLTNAVGIVQEGFSTSASFTNRPPLVTLDFNTASQSLTWCAAGLVHEAHHIVLARRRGETNQVTAFFGAPRGYKDYKNEELACFEMEIRVLKRLRAPRNELNYVRSQDGSHFDVNGDGKWDLHDTDDRIPEKGAGNGEKALPNSENARER